MSHVIPLVLACCLLLSITPPSAQQSAKLPVVGVLVTHASPSLPTLSSRPLRVALAASGAPADGRRAAGARQAAWWKAAGCWAGRHRPGRRRTSCYIQQRCRSRRRSRNPLCRSHRRHRHNRLRQQPRSPLEARTRCAQHLLGWRRPIGIRPSLRFRRHFGQAERRTRGIQDQGHAAVPDCGIRWHNNACASLFGLLSCCLHILHP